MLIALAAVRDHKIHQMDVKTAFLKWRIGGRNLHGAEGFVVPSKEKKMCRLVKSLYGLKQTSKQ